MKEGGNVARDKCPYNAFLPQGGLISLPYTTTLRVPSFSATTDDVVLSDALANEEVERFMSQRNALVAETSVTESTLPLGAIAR